MNKIEKVEKKDESGSIKSDDQDNEKTKERLLDGKESMRFDYNSNDTDDQLADKLHHII
eukprot:CAMPEP_0116899066 /NCGR_PEP_ID=MMETSP0467-20121206/7706_1 /TAXON_ID=283647 /ORGANISM="Mesodinium pulex, Strain SPMC105" /LENGTH=58 /DNA_ID=CAMNT_0004571657 /DNA_START=1628 /DNA_END=1804 /DNA_ORIENTATION=+